MEQLCRAAPRERAVLALERTHVCIASCRAGQRCRWYGRVRRSPSSLSPSDTCLLNLRCALKLGSCDIYRSSDQAIVRCLRTNFVIVIEWGNRRFVKLRSFEGTPLYEL